MVYGWENIEKSTYIGSECPYSGFQHPCSVSKQKPRDYPPCLSIHVFLKAADFCLKNWLKCTWLMQNEVTPKVKKWGKYLWSETRLYKLVRYNVWLSLNKSITCSWLINQSIEIKCSCVSFFSSYLFISYLSRFKQASLLKIQGLFKDFLKTFLLFSRTKKLWKILIYTLKFYYQKARLHYYRY